MSPRTEIREFIVHNFFVDTFGDEDSFVHTGIIDSMGILELVGFLEERFGIKVQDTELVSENLDCLAHVTSFVERKRAQVLN
jgi:acyl carrier protein